ncbi:GntR family transcriptional regulator [Salipiger marinus]|uniref:DNA-binding transcriptional regulator, GntR family n=1 Tax=Salipiger marinus TaxID=555512 RepID=A0A1G8M6N7_9RHOB|nr:GntR family transcriptional regulator [Salipiger marinus]SDI63619.1 DNA-binding transcriptional regulator, GntR family [Salipiger marinus]
MSLSKLAFTRIRDAIVSGDLAFGERLSEVQIAEALEMSKAPVRTAFLELRDRRLVTIVPQAGTYVFSPSREDVYEMSSFRAILETAGMRLSLQAARATVLDTLATTIPRMEKALGEGNWKDYEAADMEYHLAFINNSGNSYLPQAYDLTAPAIKALRVRLQAGTGAYRKQSFGEHKQILRHLEAGDPDQAAEALRAHIMVINEAKLDLPEKRGSRAKALNRSLEEYRQIFR